MSNRVFIIRAAWLRPQRLRVIWSNFFVRADTLDNASTRLIETTNRLFPKVIVAVDIEHSNQHSGPC